MKHLKTKLMAAVAMLLVATVMLTSASFAWFTISTAPEIASLDTEVVTNENLEIALAETGDSGKSNIPDAAAEGESYAASKTTAAYTWGNIIDLTSGVSGDVAADAYDDLDRTIRPVTLDSTGGFKYPVYGQDGRIKELSAMTVETMENGFGNITDGTDIYGYYVDFWMRSNVGGAVKLVDATDRASSDPTDNGFSGGGSSFQVTTDTTADDTAKATIAENMRVAFQILYDEGGTTADTYARVADATYTSGDNSISFISTDYEVITLTANKAALVRMYVYLEGEDVTNAAASIDNAKIFGELNVQFGIENVDNSMHVTADETYKTADTFHS